jgi:serine/threonine protein kinase
MDLKPNNVLLKKINGVWGAVICDFGFACRVNTIHRIPVSTRNYTAPEQLRENQQAHPSMDMWNLGLIVVELIRGPHANEFLSINERDFPEKDFQNPEKLPDIYEHWLTLHLNMIQKLHLDHPIERLGYRLLGLSPSFRPTEEEVIIETMNIAYKNTCV